MSEVDLVRKHVSALIREASDQQIPSDVLGRLLLQEVTSLWRKDRELDDIANELHFTADNLDPDGDYMFMRP